MKKSLIVGLLVFLASCSPKFNIKTGECYRLTAKDGTELAFQVLKIGKDKTDTSPTATTVVLLANVTAQQVLGYSASTKDQIEIILSEHHGRKVECSKAMEKAGS